MKGVVFLKVQDVHRVLWPCKDPALGFTYASQLDFLEVFAKQFRFGELLSKLKRVRFAPAKKGGQVFGWTEWQTPAAAKAAADIINMLTQESGRKRSLCIHHAEMGTKPMLQGLYVRETVIGILEQSAPVQEVNKFAVLAEGPKSVSTAPLSPKRQASSGKTIAASKSAGVTADDFVTNGQEPSNKQRQSLPSSNEVNSKVDAASSSDAGKAKSTAEASSAGEASKLAAAETKLVQNPVSAGKGGAEQPDKRQESEPSKAGCDVAQKLPLYTYVGQKPPGWYLGTVELGAGHCPGKEHC